MKNKMERIKYFCQKYEVMIFICILAALSLYAEYLPISNQMSENEPELYPPNPAKPLPSTGTEMQIFKKAAICADCAICAEIGRDILAKNGSAVDAAIAAMICNTVVNLQSAGMGGGFFMTVYKRDENKSYCLNARERAPLKGTIEMFNKENSTSNGPLAVAVPGEIKGYQRAHAKFGKLPWKQLVQPSIDLCKSGYILGEHHYTSSFKTNLHIDDENIREWFFDKDGNFKKPGTRVHPTRMCEFLTKLSENGPEDFYTGELSKLFLQDIKELGGIIVAEDLETYDAEWQEPVCTTLKNGDSLHTFPAPGAGPLLAFILNVLDGYNFTANNIEDEDQIALTSHRIAEVFKYAYAKRTTLGDPKFVNVKDITDQLISKSYAESVRSKINDCKTSSDPSHYGAQYFSKDDKGTSHISVLAENGDAVAVTSTINIYFGAGITSKRTGIILNSAMDDFSYPHVLSYFGLSGSPANRMEPGKIPVSSMAPSILTDSGGNVKIAIGGAGGPKITTSIALTLIRLLWFEENLKEAIDTPRIHHQLLPMELHYEYGVLDGVVRKLQALGHKATRKNTESIVYALQRVTNGIATVTDTRKLGGGAFGI